MMDNLTISTLDPTQVCSNESLRGEWNALIRAHPNMTAIYASPDWFAHLLATSLSPLRLVTVHDEEGTLVGVVPVKVKQYDLQFSVSGRILARWSISTAYLLGSVPVLPESETVHAAVLRKIFESFPDCHALYADAVPTESYFWRFLVGPTRSHAGLHTHVLEGPIHSNVLKLRPSFESYLKEMGTKARANLRREIRQLNQFSGGRLRLVTATAQEDVEAFLIDAQEVSQRSWQHRVIGERVRADEQTTRSLRDLSARGLLRSYLLKIDNRPVAFVIGYQYAGVYSYAEIGFDEELRDYSPGKVLLYLLVEDLHRLNSPLVLDFGVGDALYKRRFGNFKGFNASCLLLRHRKILNPVLVAHTVFRYAVRLARRAIGRSIRE